MIHGETEPEVPPSGHNEELALLRQRVGELEARLATFQMICEQNPVPMVRLVLESGPPAEQDRPTEERGRPADARFLQVNDAFCRLLGSSREELLSRPVRDVIHPEDWDKVVTAGQALVQQQPSVPVVYRLLEPAGQPIWVEAIGGIVRDQAGTPLFGLVVMQDIRARIESEQQRQRMEARLRETQKLESLGVLAGGVAHDFNNLLTVILGNASLVETDLPPSSPHRHLLAQVVAASWRAADLCKQMLAYSGRGQFVVARMDLNGLIREMLGLLQATISRTIQFRLHLAEGLPAILTDSSQLRQMILSLVVNAAEAIGEQPGEVSLTTRLIHADPTLVARMYLAPELPEGDYLALEVSDTGCGMDQATREKIFDPFFTTKFLGRGLGLAAVVGIVRGHQGAIQVESTPGKGSTFRILFPPAPPETP